jgi:hypothetical protein
LNNARPHIGVAALAAASNTKHRNQYCLNKSTSDYFIFTPCPINI